MPPTPSSEAIYFVVALPDPEISRAGKRSRTWAWYKNLPEALQACSSNEGDLFEEGYYRYACVEAVEPGMLGDSEAVAWYEARYTSGRIDPEVVRLPEAPRAFEGTCGFSVG